MAKVLSTAPGSRNFAGDAGISFCGQVLLTKKISSDLAGILHINSLQVAWGWLLQLQDGDPTT